MNENPARMSHQEQTHEDIIRAAARILMGAVLDLIEADSHHFGDRPCQTCQTVTVILQRPFGCVKKASTLENRQEHPDFYQ